MTSSIGWPSSNNGIGGTRAIWLKKPIMNPRVDIGINIDSPEDRIIQLNERCLICFTI